MTRVRKLAIVKLSSIGDVVHALPVSAALKRSFPHLALTWIVEEMSAPMVTGNPCLDEVIVIPAEWRANRKSAKGMKHFMQLRQQLQVKGFDVALDLQGLSKSALVTWATGAKYRYGYDWLRELAPFMMTRVPRRPESVHVVDQFLDVARFLGAAVEPVEFPLAIPQEAVDSITNKLAELGLHSGQPLLVVNPSSGGGGFKGWPPERFGQFINQFAAQNDLNVVLVGSKADQEAAQQVTFASNSSVHSLVGQTSLKELAAILNMASLHVCGDTGSAHIAAALSTPVVSIFGRSNPARLAPYGMEAFAVHRRDCCHAVCRDFHQSSPVNSKQRCLSPPPACLPAVSVDDVLKAATRALAKQRIVVG